MTTALPNNPPSKVVHTLSRDGSHRFDHCRAVTVRDGRLKWVSTSGMMFTIGFSNLVRVYLSDKVYYQWSEGKERWVRR